MASSTKLFAAIVAFPILLKPSAAADLGWLFGEAWLSHSRVPKSQMRIRRTTRDQNRWFSHTKWMTIDPLTPMLAHVQTARDKLLTAPIDGSTYLLSGTRLNMLAKLTEGAVTDGDLQAARALVAEFEAKVPHGNILGRLSTDQLASLSSYQAGLAAIGQLLAGRTAQAAAQAAAQGPLSRDMSRPGLPSSMLDYTISKMGYLKPFNAEAECMSRGFVKDGSTYVHIDGSWVSVVNGTVEIGWKGYGLGDLGWLYGGTGGWH
jgi:hypothetical protein